MAKIHKTRSSWLKGRNKLDNKHIWSKSVSGLSLNIGKEYIPSGYFVEHAAHMHFV